MNLLIVDDSKLNRVLASSLVESNHIDLNVLFAETGEEALEIIDSNNIDIVLLDIIMPGMGGIETLKQIKEVPSRAEIKVLMYSTVSEKDYFKKCFELGATDFIHKPIEEVEYLSRLKSSIKQKRLEIETKEYIEEIKEQKIKISDANIQLMQQEKMAGIGQLAAGVAHEINNPLGFIASNFAVLKDYVSKFVEVYAISMSDDSPEEIQRKVYEYFEKEDFDYIFEDIDDLLNETSIGLNRVTEIVKSLRNFSRIDKSELFDSYDLNEGLKDTLLIAKNRIEHKVDLKVEYGDIGIIEAHGSEVNQVLLNIVLNSIEAVNEKHTDDIGSVHIKTYVENNYVVVSFKDDGIGIDEEHISSLFNPFYTTKPVGEGLGLGLSMSYDIIINKHRGKIDVISDPGVGTEFLIFLPRINIKKQ